MTEIKYFILGSLTQSSVPFRRLRDFILSTEPANWGGEGELLTLKYSDLLVELLDQFHGFNKQDPEKSIFFRQQISVDTDFGQTTAWAYVMNTGKLSESQKTYILRLGRTSGREIVPIDLPLYRELINLELIVDKGRRLALSKRGQEVFKYLSH